jgi:hypothetical protein
MINYFIGVSVGTMLSGYDLNGPSRKHVLCCSLYMYMRAIIVTIFYFSSILHR